MSVPRRKDHWTQALMKVSSQERERSRRARLIDSRAGGRRCEGGEGEKETLRLLPFNVLVLNVVEDEGHLGGHIVDGLGDTGGNVEHLLDDLREGRKQ